MKPEVLFTVGLCLSLFGLWGGSYLIHLVADTWAVVPALVTAISVIIAGVIIMSVAVPD